MRPIVYSEKNAQQKSIGWNRVGHHINYSRNLTNLNCPLLARDRAHFMLEWQMVSCHPSVGLHVLHYAHMYTLSFTLGDKKLNAKSIQIIFKK